MQSIFRLPWCSEHQIKLSEKASLDKMRPMVEIPALQDLKRKRSDSQDAVSPGQTIPITKKQQMDFVRQFSPASHLSQSPTQSSMTPASRVAQANPASAPLLPKSPVATGDAVAGAEIEGTRHQPVLPPASTQASTSSSVPQTKTINSASIAMDTSEDENVKLSKVQQVIENEFNMQILMKHNELRLIEQELAKCQIALEQLRRCELRPYPGTESPSLAVSEGAGPAITPRPGHSVPSHPAPYGVTDGPYSRHYAKWLLRDPQFDSVSPEALALAEARIQASGRPTRNSNSSFHVPRKSASKTLGTSTRSADPLHSIPNYPAAPVKDKSQPLVLPRSSDGQLVKLICNNCQRGNFSSIQGFLNHCRIAHKVDYKSHDAAALDCGRLLDADEKANMPPEALKVHAPKPSASRASALLASTPAKSQPPASGLVHPYITAPVPAFRPIAPADARMVPSLSSPVPSTYRNVPFKPSSQTPILSSLYQKRGIGGDLDQAVASAKQKVDLYTDVEMMSPDTVSDPNSPATPFGPGARMPVGNHGYFHQPQSRKGFGSNSQRPRPAPIAPAQPRDFHMHSQLSSPHDLASAGLSPNTADSNPGMVSDHEDDDHSVSEEDTPHVEMPAVQPSIASVGRTCSEQMEIDIEDDHVDMMGQRGVIIRRNSMLGNEPHGYSTSGSTSRKMGGN
ncbi:Putative protein AHC1 [Septoria linicola]|uniref:AHC1-like C2H2 zinc-finger domain-containing protein n=1 Tax=Septoria linicola TaxID=215465 RepID=A0A9Q9B738_9PEZI|nr:putative protein AHC1 [Septoria linicola]USW58542.1 Putative protein AHC1 [Septoria linicola]